METILIVEDDPHTRNLMEIILKNNGFQTVTATNGIEALDVLDKRMISLIILDIMMPEMDGYQLTQNLREAVWSVKRKVDRKIKWICGNAQIHRV